MLLCLHLLLYGYEDNLRSVISGTPKILPMVSYVCNFEVTRPWTIKPLHLNFHFPLWFVLNGWFSNIFQINIVGYVLFRNYKFAIVDLSMMMNVFSCFRFRVVSGHILYLSNLGVVQEAKDDPLTRIIRWPHTGKIYSSNSSFSYDFFV